MAGEYIYNQIKNTKNKIACLTGDLRTSTSSQRLQGFQKALEERNYPYDPYILSGDYSIESGYKPGKKLIKSISTDQLAGVFCFNDLIAYGFIRAIKEKNLKWQNFNIVGYDSLQIGEVLGYSFPSVSQNIPRLAKQACKLLLEQMKQEDSLQIQLEVELKKSELS